MGGGITTTGDSFCIAELGSYETLPIKYIKIFFSAVKIENVIGKI